MYDVDYATDDTIDSTIMRKQGDLGSKARKERARKTRAKAERCVRPFMVALSELDVLHLTLHCFGRRAAEKDVATDANVAKCREAMAEARRAAQRCVCMSYNILRIPNPIHPYYCLYSVVNVKEKA